MESVFPAEGWDFVHAARDAVRNGDAERVRELGASADESIARQLGAMAPSLVLRSTGVDPSPDTITLLARTLHRHLNHYDPNLATVAEVVEALRAVLGQTDMPRWADGMTVMTSVVGFFMPDGDEEQQLRTQLEPLWTSVMEDL